MLLNKFKRRQSPLSEWLYELDMRRKDLVGKKCQTLFSEFRAWCENNGYTKLMTMFSFKEDLCALYDIEIDMGIDENGKLKGQTFSKHGEYDGEFKPF